MNSVLLVGSYIELFQLYYSMDLYIYILYWHFTGFHRKKWGITLHMECSKANIVQALCLKPYTA